MSEPLVAGPLPCPQCGADAEPEEDGQILWFVCPDCGAEFGYQPVPLAGPLCAAGLSIRELERIRDENLVGILQSLKTGHSGEGWGAGKLLAEFEQRLLASAPPRAAEV